MRIILALLYLSPAWCIFLTAHADQVRLPGIDPDAELVPIVRLLSVPDEYHNKKVLTTGYVSLEHHGQALYMNKESKQNTVFLNGLWISFPEGTKRSYLASKKDSVYMMVAGVFDAENHGHLGLWPAAIRVNESWVENLVEKSKGTSSSYPRHSEKQDSNQKPEKVTGSEPEPEKEKLVKSGSDQNSR